MLLDHIEDLAYYTRTQLEIGNWKDLNESGPVFWGQLADLYFIDVVQVAPWFQD